MPAPSHLFRPFYRAQDRAIHLRRWTLALFGLVCLQTLVIAVMALQSPRVIVKDYINGTPPTLERLRSDPPTTLADARLFFGQMVKLRYGWNSRSLQTDLQRFLQACHPAHRAAQISHLRGSVADDKAADALQSHRKPSRMQQWEAAQVANLVLFPPHAEDVFCERRATDAIWDCALEGKLLVRSLLTDVSKTTVVEQASTFVATLVEVPHGIDTPYGLVLGHLDMVPSQNVAGGENR